MGLRQNSLHGAKDPLPKAEHLHQSASSQAREIRAVITGRESTTSVDPEVAIVAQEFESRLTGAVVNFIFRAECRDFGVTFGRSAVI